MKKIIKLQTHDGSNNYLQKLDGHHYKLITENSLYLSSGTYPDGSFFIDPSGGPILAEGHGIAGTHWIISKLKFIKNIGWIITVTHDLPR